MSPNSLCGGHTFSHDIFVHLIHLANFCIYFNCVNIVYHLNTISDLPMLHITQKCLLSKNYMQNVGYIHILVFYMKMSMYFTAVIRSILPING